MSLELEQNLIGALLNAPEAAEAARAARPEYFTDPYLGAMKARIDAALIPSGGGFDVGTLVEDMRSHPRFESMGGAGYIGRLYADVPPYVAQPGPSAAKLVEAHRRRQTLLLLDQQHGAISRGEDPDAVVDGFRPYFDALRSLSGTARFQPIDLSDLSLPVRPWLIRNLLPRRGLGFVAGQSGAGKSFLTLDICLGLATGRPKILGERAKRCGVVYVAAEDFIGVKGRIQAWRVTHGLANDAPFALIGGSVNLLDRACVEDLNRSLAAIAERFAGAGVELGMVVFDTLAGCLPGADENKSTEMSMAIGALETIAAASGAFVLAVAHHGKGGVNAGIRGWSGTNAASDMTLTVERDEAEPDVRTVTLTKIKNGRDGKSHAFRLQPVGLGIRDEDGEELQSCVCAFDASPDRDTPARPARLPPQAEIALRAIRHCHDSGVTFPVPSGAPRATWSRAVEIAAAENIAIRNGFAKDRTIALTSQRFSTALQRLVAEDRVQMDEPKGLVWLL